MKLKDASPSSPAAPRASGGRSRTSSPPRARTVVVADVERARRRGSRRLHPGGHAVTVDVADPTRSAHGRHDGGAATATLDILVNNAAIVPFTAWDDIDFAEWRRIMAVNLDGVFLTCRRRRTRCASTATAASSTSPPTSMVAGTPNLAHYVASKGGVFGFTRALATELGKYGITVNAVAPGPDETEGTLAIPHANAFDFVQSLQAIPRRASPRTSRPPWRSWRRRRRAGSPGRCWWSTAANPGSGADPWPTLPRSGASARSSPSRMSAGRSPSTRERLGFTVEATYDDPPYATLTLGGVRLSLAEQGHPSPDRPGVDDGRCRLTGRLPVVLVLEVADARRHHADLAAEGAPSSRSRTHRRGVACASSSSTRTATWSRSNSRAMKAVVLAGAGELRVAEVPDRAVIGARATRSSA